MNTKGTEVEGNELGQASIELILVIPLFLVILAVTWYIGEGLHIKQRAVIVSKCASFTKRNLYYSDPGRENTLWREQQEKLCNLFFPDKRCRIGFSQSSALVSDNTWSDKYFESTLSPLADEIRDLGATYSDECGTVTEVYFIPAIGPGKMTATEVRDIFWLGTYDRRYSTNKTSPWGAIWSAFRENASGFMSLGGSKILMDILK